MIRFLLSLQIEYWNCGLIDAYAHLFFKYFYMVLNERINKVLNAVSKNLAFYGLNMHENYFRWLFSDSHTNHAIGNEAAMLIPHFPFPFPVLSIKMKPFKPQLDPQEFLTFQYFFPLSSPYPTARTP